MKPKWISLVQLLILMSALTYAVYGQQPLDKSATDALQDDRILNLRTGQSISNQRIDDMAKAILDLTSSVNRGTGAVVGFGLAITVLQAFHTVAAWKRKS